MNQPRMFYFGVKYTGLGHDTGHFLYDEHMRSLRHGVETRGTFPWDEHEIDGTLQPHREGCDRRSYCGCGSNPEGRALIHHKNGWTALSFWDRSLDRRGGCNSNYFAEGTFTFKEMVAMAKDRFSERWNVMRFQVVPA